MTRLGRISYSRSYYYDSTSGCGCSPLDEALDIREMLSAGVRHDVVKLSVDRTFEKAAQTYEELTRVRVGTTTIWEQTQAAGTLARPALNPIATTSVSASAGSSRPSMGMAVLMDGFMAYVREESWKEVKIGCVCAFDGTGEVRVKRAGSEPVDVVKSFQPSYVMHLGGPESLSVKLAAEAQARRWHDAPERAVIGDGAAWIWNIAQREYASAAHIVDWYHAKEHLYAAGEVLYPDQPDQRRGWVEQQADLLYVGQADHIADHLLRCAAQARPANKARLETEAGYLTTHYERMQYQDFQHARLPIGSGTVESGAKQAKLRVSAPGMRWSRTGLENLLPLQAAFMCHTFDDLWRRICPF